MLFEFDQRSVFEADAGRVDVIGALVLRLVHQLVGALEQLLCEFVRDRAALGDVAQHEADDADVDPHGLRGQSRIVAGPVASLYHLNELISTRQTAHQRPRCSRARNASTCSMKRRKFMSRVLGSRCTRSVRSATRSSKYLAMLLTVASRAESSSRSRLRRSVKP